MGHSIIVVRSVTSSGEMGTNAVTCSLSCPLAQVSKAGGCSRKFSLVMVRPRPLVWRASRELGYEPAKANPFSSRIGGAQKDLPDPLVNLKAHCGHLLR